MSRDEAMKRRVGQVHRWAGKDFAPVVEAFQKIGAENATVELCIGLDKEGRDQPWMRVVDFGGANRVTAEDDSEWVNVSRPCPPFCD